MLPDLSNRNEQRNIDYACCDNCIFFFSQKYLGGIDDVHECRRYPPFIVFSEGTTEESFQSPLVEWNHWCGEWKKRY